MTVHYFCDMGATFQVALALAIAASFGGLIAWFRAQKRIKAYNRTKRRIESLKDQARRDARSKNEEIRRGVPMLIRILYRTAEKEGIELSGLTKRELDRIAYISSPAYHASLSPMPLSGYTCRTALPMLPLAPAKPAHELEIEVEVGSEDEPLQIERVLETPAYQPTETIEHKMLSLPEESPSAKEIAWFIEQELVGSEDHRGIPDEWGPPMSVADTPSILIPIGLRPLSDWSNYQSRGGKSKPKK